MTTLESTCPFGEGYDFTDPDVLLRGHPGHRVRRAAQDGAGVVERAGRVDLRRRRLLGDQPPRRHQGHLPQRRRCVVHQRQGRGHALPDGITADQLDLTKALLINHDAPEHTRLRKLVSRLFTPPRSVAALEHKLAVAAREIVAAAKERNSGNFVDEVAMPLPLLAIADLIGVPEEDREKIFHWSNCIMNTDDPDFDADPTTANAELMGYAYNMAEARRKCPADDIVTRLVQADIDGDGGDGITEVEFAFFVILLAVAGNETTRNAMTHGMNAFFENPDQWELFKRERPDTAIEEIIRWATPVHCFQRTALVDTEIGGVTIRKGQRAGLFYSSANYDEEVFENPFTFDILRNPNPHLAFGGNGAHFCIGANLARMEIKLMFNEIADQIPDISKLAEPLRLRSGWINGVKDLQVSYK